MDGCMCVNNHSRAMRGGIERRLAFCLGEQAEETAFPAARTTRRLVSRPMPGCFTVRYDAWGDYAPGRWAWLLTDIQPLKPPVRTTGRQGFFDLPQGWMVT